MSLRPTTNRFFSHHAQSADERAVALLHDYAYHLAAEWLRPGVLLAEVSR